MEHDFLGSGWAFPVRPNARGGIGLARRERDIEEAIYIILSTPKGQRIMRPEFGCGIHDLAFHPNNAATWSLAEHYVEEALSFWEPRIRILSVKAFPDRLDPAKLLIEIRYEINTTLDQRTLVYPFYRIPGEPSSG